MTTYHVGNNTPGYLPDGEPYHVATWIEALGVLHGDIEDGLDSFPWYDDPRLNGELWPTARAIESEYTAALADINTLQVAAAMLASWEDGLGSSDELSYTLPINTMGRAYWIMRCEESDCESEES